MSKFEHIIFYVLNWIHFWEGFQWCVLVCLTVIFDNDFFKKLFFKHCMSVCFSSCKPKQLTIDQYKPHWKQHRIRLNEHEMRKEKERGVWWSVVRLCQGLPLGPPPHTHTPFTYFGDLYPTREKYTRTQKNPSEMLRFKIAALQCREILAFSLSLSEKGYWKVPK